MPKVLIVDDDDKFRTSLAKHLTLHGFETIELTDGEDAIRLVRADSDIDIILLEHQIPGMGGEQVLKEIKRFRPETQVIMLMAYGSIESATEAGRLKAYSYIKKPCDFERLIKVIEAAREDKVHAMAWHEITHIDKGSLWKWLVGSHNSRPGVVILGLILFAVIVLTPPPKGQLDLLSSPKTGQISDSNLGYSGYKEMQPGENIIEYYSNSAKMGETTVNGQGQEIIQPLLAEQVAFKARVMVGILVVAALFWATGAIPIGITALLVGVLMYFFGVLHPDDIAKAYAKDAVIFIFGVLAISSAISKTGLDRRIGLLLLAPASSFSRLLFLFLPLFAIVCSFVSEHALIAFIIPLFMMIYTTSIRAAGVKKDRALAMMFVLSVCFTANSGGPGSPAAGGRNAVMLGILADYDIVPTFGQWIQYGIPFVPVMALVIGLYFYLMFRKKVIVKKLNVSSIVKQASEKIGPMNKNEYLTAFTLIALILLWILGSHKYGLGGPVILCVVFLSIFRVIQWRDIASIPWDVVALYASACALGKGLAMTGASLYLAEGFLRLLPEFFRSGEGLAIAASFITGVITNFMSDGATVSAIGPITIPMATVSSTHPWMAGFATAFASSFAHMLIIGTPNNAIAYAMAKDPLTGEQLVTLTDFLKHGFIIFLLSFAVLWIWVFFGYWRFIGF